MACPTSPRELSEVISEFFEERPGCFLYRNELSPEPKPPVGVYDILKAKLLMRRLKAHFPALNYTQVKLRSALVLVAEHHREKWSELPEEQGLADEAAEAEWADEMAKRIRAALKDIRHTTTVTPQSPWLKKLWCDDAEAAESKQSPEGKKTSKPSPKIRKTPAARESALTGIDWHGGTTDGYFTGYDDVVEAGWRVPWQKPKQPREHSTNIEQRGNKMWCEWSDGFTSDMNDELTPEVWAAKKNAASKHQKKEAPSALWTGETKDGVKVRIHYSPQNKRDPLLILKVDAKQKC